MAAVQQKKKKKGNRSPERRNVWLLVLTTLLVIGSVALFMPPSEKINQGLDIQGGLSVVLTARSDTGEPITTEDMEKSRAVIESRVNALGASEAVVQVQGTDQILVQIPGLSDPEEALNTIGKTGSLTFARLDTFTDEEVVTKIKSGEYGTEGTITDSFGNKFPSGELIHLKVDEGTYTPLVTGENIASVNVGRRTETSTDYAVNIRLDAEGTSAFAQATADLAPTNGLIVIILDNEVQSAPAVQSEIPGGEVQITGGYTLEQAQSLQTVLESGSLPVSFEYAQSQVVGPTLGQDALVSGVLAAAVGLIIVLLYLLVFYRGLGALTAATMVAFAVIYLGVLALLSRFGLFSLSLSGIAGVVLTIGMAADASILMLERFREEIRMGRSIRAASITGVKEGIVTAIDADLVSLVSALTLFFLASASVKGFGLTLSLGIICNIITMLVFMMPLIRLLAPHVIARHPKFWDTDDCEELARSLEAGKLPAKIRGRFVKRDINFLGLRKIFLSIAAVAVVAVAVIVGVRGMNFGIEFQGGTSIAFHDTGDTTIDEVRSAFADAGEENATVQTTTTDNNAGFLVRTSNTSPDSAAQAAGKVADTFGWAQESYEVTTIGPDWGAGVIQSSAIALLVSFLLIVVYIAIRFEYKMGVAAIVALLHDIIIVVGIYALVGREVTPNAVAALLTILGYSLYDKVVVFHCINENMKNSDAKCTFMSIANHSINQVILRSINTSLTSLVPVLAMLFFGGETLKDFAFAMVIGLVCGAYSTISVATPVYCIWKTRESKNTKLVKKYGSEVQRFFLGYLPNDPRLLALQSASATVTDSLVTPLVVQGNLSGARKIGSKGSSEKGSAVAKVGAVSSEFDGVGNTAEGATKGPQSKAKKPAKKTSSKRRHR